MRVLLVHNFYGSSAPSGENAVFEAEKALLQKNGHEVAVFARHSDEIRTHGMMGLIRGALATPWNPWMAIAIQKKIADFQPDVVHVHNTFPLISPAIFHAIGKKVARVLTLHNYRIFCPAAIPMRNGKVCTACLDKKSSFPALLHGCYRDSRIATAPLAFNVALHRFLGTWKNNVDAFIALSDFQAKLMAEAGLPAAKVDVKPNFFSGNPPVVPWQKRASYVVFVGRLSAEKGVENLLRAWQMWGSKAPELLIVGAGEMRVALERMAVGLPVKFTGQVNSSEAQAQIAKARLLILPSECFEGFPMTIREAFAFGTPAAVSNIGPLPSIVKHDENGVVFEPGNPQSLLNEARTAWETPNLLEKLGAGARAEFEVRYTEEINYKILMEIYEKAIHAVKNKE
jgi:glycosyltransferase involved in cell wall biosynthesis